MLQGADGVAAGAAGQPGREAVDRHGTIVVVGGGLAGLRSCETLRAEGFAGRLVLVGAERDLPYDRPPLSKQYLAGEWDAERLPLRADDKLEQLGVTWQLGAPAQQVSVDERTVVLSDGTEIAFDGLVVASGAAPRTLTGAGLAGVHLLRTRADADGLRSALAAGGRLVVVGAGFIGTEVAATARQLRVEVTVVDPVEVPLGRVLPSPLGRALAEVHRQHGVTVRTGTSVVALVDRDGRQHPLGPPTAAPLASSVSYAAGGRAETTGAPVAGVVLGDGRVEPADVVLIAIGVKPADDWLAGSGVRLDDGVVVDRCLWAAPGVVAAGDVARWPTPPTGQLRRVEHWTNASEQGVVAARTLLAGPAAAPYEPVPYVWSDQFGTKLQVVGLPTADDELTVVDGTLSEWRFVAVTHRRGALSGALAAGRPRQLMTLRPLVQRQASVQEAAGLLA